MAVARRLGAAERQVHFRADGGRVHVEETRVDIAHRREGLVDVAGVDRGRQSIGHVVGNPDRLVERPAGEHRHDRPEDLLARDRASTA